MSTADRRRKITEKLTEKGGPLKGGDLAVQFGVSRQVIVQDMAVLRAEGLQVVATPRGYMLLSPLR
ncbi:MAG: HTH domain-containing protein, partial [Aminobacteriaceae bacterium]